MNPLHPDEPELMDRGKYRPEDLPETAKARKPSRPRKEQGIAYSFRAFKHRSYTLFWCGAVVSNTGNWLSNLTVPYVLYTMTGSALWVAYAAVAQFVPTVLLAPWGGSDRKSVV